MGLFGRERNSLNFFIYDSTIDLKDRSFIVFSMAMIMSFVVSVPCGLIMGEPISSTITTLVGTIIFTILVSIAYKTRKIGPFRLVVAVLDAFVLLPGLYITNGGINSGAPLWILLGFYYLVMITDGKFRTVLSAITVFILLACMMLEYRYPQYVTQYSGWSRFFDCFAALITVVFVISFIVSFQNRLYRRESRLAADKANELEELNRAQNRFFSSMSHEIRTPINTVLGMNEIILRQEDASEEIKKDARNIQGAGKLLLALINDILDVSKIEAGKMDIVPVNYNVASLLSEIVNMIWLKTEEKGLKFNVDIDPDVPETLFGDEVRIKQILINLLNNAVKYTKEGSISLHMECETTDNENVLLKIVVSDTGIGIKPEALPFLFDTFKRVDEEKNRYIEGTGLGLSIVKQLVELMGGEITVNSVYSEGSTFTVSLGQGISSEKHIGNINISGTGSISNAEKFAHSFHAPDAGILIVDDNEMNLEVEKKLLEGTGMNIDMAGSGQEALLLTLNCRYDVIFMDHLMPEMDGIECYKNITTQKGGMNSNVPVIVLTANAGSDNMELYNNAGFDDYLVKPVSGVQLEDILLKYLPAEKIVRTGVTEMTGSSMSTAAGYSKKRAVTVAAGSMADLPGYIQSEMQISIIPSKIYTEEGTFYDNIDIDSEEILQYMGAELRPVTSDAPTVEEYIRFFSSELKKAHHLIFITLTSGNSAEYERVQKAAEVFENVTIINSECLSSATGILVMYAARLASQNLPVEKIISEIEEAKKHIRCSFVIKTTDVMARRDRISPFMNRIMNTFWLRPMLETKNDGLRVGKLFMGSARKCYEKYIKSVFSKNDYPETSFAFITYAGMDEEDLLWIEDELKKIVKFEHIIFQKASAGISTNCGEGTFGILYMTKSDQKYNFSAFFDRINEANDYDYDLYDEEDTEEGNAEEASYEEALYDGAADNKGTDKKGIDKTAKDSMALERKWYEGIEGINGDIAIKNSGSEESFETVLKIFHESIEKKSKEISDYYSDEDWDNYTIKVHALKSSAKLIGAMELAESAEKLEMAGKEKDAEYIHANHESFIKDYINFEEVLDNAFIKRDEDVSKTSDKPIADESLMQSVYEGIREAAEEMDCDKLDGIMESIKDYDVPKAHAERFSEIKKYAESYDYEGLLKILQ
ncbi:MAG: DegV family EDD domain-containing protein [Lachnospiraceae bacterium]|nr:DegV family EDD domain-containing protein [Lachnospiraceae bacterium]